MKFTNRVLPWFVKDLGGIRPFIKRSNHWGLWAHPIGGPRRSIHWRLPAPHHPLEVIAAQRGWGTLETGDPVVDRDGLIDAARRRHLSWIEATDQMARVLFVTPGTVRLIWHAITPCNVPALFTGQE